MVKRMKVKPDALNMPNLQFPEELRDAYMTIYVDDEVAKQAREFWSDVLIEDFDDDDDYFIGLTD